MIRNDTTDAKHWHAPGFYSNSARIPVLVFFFARFTPPYSFPHDFCDNRRRATLSLRDRRVSAWLRHNGGGMVSSVQECRTSQFGQRGCHPVTYQLQQVPTSEVLLRNRRAENSVWTRQYYSDKRYRLQVIQFVFSSAISVVRVLQRRERFRQLIYSHIRSYSK